MLLTHIQCSTKRSLFASNSTLLHPLVSQVEPEMECVAVKAFKTKFWPETSVKSNQPVVFEDFWGGNGPNGGVSENEFLVDEFLDFSKEEAFVQNEEDEEQREEKDCLSVSSQEQNSSSSGFSVKDDFLLVTASDFSVPTDDMANLEWLSHFVEDSFSEFALSYPAAGSPEKTQVLGLDRCEPEPETRPSSMLKPATFPAQVPGRARTKRSRTGGRVWSVGTPSFTETSSSSNTTTTTTTGGGAASTTSSASSSPSSTSCLIFTNTAPNLEFLDLDYLGKPPAKKKKNKSKNPASKNNGVAPPQRRCSHCGVQKTPQWRAGPLGAKTLCNACGVRFKSGRLLPEYRPACSPTFSSEVHSNSHRKVLEMRRKKETAQPDSELAPAVQSF